MFKPREMQRTLIIGSKQELTHTIDLLHQLEVAHIVDYVQPEKEPIVQLGAPAQDASSLSQQLLKLRSSAQLLSIPPEQPPVSAKMSETQLQKNIDLRIQEIELSVLSLAEDKKRVEDHLKKLDERIHQITPFSDIDIPLEQYQGYDHLKVFTGYVTEIKKLEHELPTITDEYELFLSKTTPGIMALFITKFQADAALKLLSETGYNEIKLPEGNGLPSQFLEKWTTQRQELSEKLQQITTELEEYKKRHIEFIIASEEYLSIKVQKAEAPVRFATTIHSFLIDCWIPTESLQHVKETLEKETNGSLYIESFEAAHEDEPPTMLENPKPVKRFEYLLDLYSIPNYRDIDPSIILSLIFPLFFGLMIGDIGYGICLIIVGYIFMKKLKDSEAFANIGWYIIIAGIFSSIFGLFLFGDMFGLAFQSAAAEAEASSWSSILHVTIPIPSVIHKMEALGLTELLIISIIAGSLHIGLGLLFGFISERKEHKKHAIGKIGLIFVLAAIALLIFVMADWTIGQWLKPLKTTALAPFLWNYLIPSLKAGFVLGDLVIPYVSILLVGIGLGIILGTIGGFGLVEVLEITSHLMSYTRLAAICVAKGAMAFAFNMISFTLIFNENPNAILGIVIAIMGVIVIVFLQLIVFALGSLSSGIQAVRLHYVEFFMKFYKGEGIKFTPFRYQRKYTSTE